MLSAVVLWLTTVVLSGSAQFQKGEPVPLMKGDNDCSCPAVFAPVCGVNNKTWANDCHAKCSGVQVSYPGICKGDEAWMPRRPATPDPRCKCSKRNDSVCGSDGVTYPNAHCAKTCGNISVYLSGTCEKVCPCDTGYDPVCDDSTQTQYINACFASYCMNVDNNALFAARDRRHCNWTIKKLGKKQRNQRQPHKIEEN